MDGPPGPAPRSARSQKTTMTVSVVQFFLFFFSSVEHTFRISFAAPSNTFLFFQSFISSLLQKIPKIDNVLFGGAAIQRSNRVLVHYSGISLVNFIIKTLDLR